MPVWNIASTCAAVPDAGTNIRSAGRAPTFSPPLRNARTACCRLDSLGPNVAEISAGVR